MTDSSATKVGYSNPEPVMANSTCTNVEAIRKHDHAELIADGIVHAFGVSLGLIGSITIVLTACSTHGIDAWSVVIYAIGLLTMLGFSAAYNLCSISYAKSLLRRFDHSAIYLMIAGTYTPFIAQMKIGLISAGLAAGVWSIAIAGIALKLVLPGRLDRLSVVIYLALGWSGAAFFKQVASALPSVSLWLLAVGGVAYSTGVLFHLWRNLRFQNAIWHGFVLAGACCHYLAVLACVRA